jgi:hypothetical protein
VQRSVCSNESCDYIVSQGCHELLRVVGTHVDEATVALGEELVGSGNVHALVVGVEKSKAELDRVLSVNVGGVGHREALVVAGGSLEFGRVGVLGHHLFGGLLSEGLASGVEVGNVTNEFGSGADGFRDHSADRSSTSRDENGSEDWLTLGETVGRVIASLDRESSTVGDSRAAGNSGDDGGEGRHFEKSQTLR